MNMAASRNDAQKQAAAEEITETVARCCNAHAELVYVVFEEVSPDSLIFQPQRCAAQGEFADEDDEDHDDLLHVADGSRQWAEMPEFPRPTRF